MPKINKERGLFLLTAVGLDGEPQGITLFNYSEALKKAHGLSIQSRQIVLQEFGQFRANNKKREEFLEIWWSKDVSEQEPKRRGYGVYKPEVGRTRWVEYEPTLTGPPDQLFEDADLHRVFPSDGAFMVGYSREDEEMKSEYFADCNAALERAEELTLRDDMSVSVWETGRYSLHGEEQTGSVMFWWKEAGTYYSHPIGRGIALFHLDDEAPILVAYEPASSSDEIDDTSNEQDEEEQESEEQSTNEDDDNYVKTHCEDCGLIMPLYAKYEYSYEQETGRSSGSARYGRSSSRRSSSRGRSSYTSGSSSSYSTGRTYYTTRTLELCKDCYDRRIAADEEEAKAFWAVVGVAAAVVVVLILGFMIYARLHS